MSRYYDRAGQPITSDQWAEMFKGSAYPSRTVARDEVDGASISTVWLGLDHGWGEGPPLIFETMVFGSPLDQECWRYSTEAEARAGHAAAIEAVRNRPPAVGDLVTIPWKPNDRFELRCIEDDEVWVRDSEGAHLTLRADCIERVES